MSDSPPIVDILNDDAFAPLKRNHACLECKKRKIRCDATRPACGPCMRSHAHSARLAQKNKVSPPPLVCSWVDSDSPEPENGNIQSSAATVKAMDGRKRSGEVKKARGSLAGGKNMEREKERRRDEDRDILLARIADLEARLAGLSPSEGSPASSRITASSGPQRTASTAFTSVNNSPEIQAVVPEQFGLKTASTSKLGAPSTHRQAWVEDVNPAMDGIDAANMGAVPDMSIGNMDFSGLFMVPANWPPNLPSPFLLDHLVETFFTHAPQMPRMIHRATLMTRLRLPPTHPDFPHPSLLHAICAAAATYTAWVNSLPPEALDESVDRHKAMYGTIEGVEDFGLAQAEAGQKSIRMSTQTCMMGPGNMVVEITQASIILSDLYFTKGMPLQGWIIAGTPPRLLKALEFMNKNKRVQYKEPMARPSKSAIEREERLATVWMAFIMDAGYALNSYWSGSLELDELLCNLPVAAEEFKLAGFDSEPNPQTAQSLDMLASHPVADSFVLVAKATTLISRVAKWLRGWTQRDVVPGDENEGLRQPSFTALVNDIYVFQASVPSAMRNIFRILDASSTMPFDANIMLVHILPNIALCMIHEPFVDWQSPEYNHSLTQIQRGYEAILGVLHLIPSNLDISLVTTSLMCFCLYTVGRLIAHFVQRSALMQQYGLAVRHRTDLQTVQNILSRYGQKHKLGQMMNEFLTGYLNVIQTGKLGDALTICSSMEEYANRGPTKASYSHPDATTEERAESYLNVKTTTNISGEHTAGVQNWAQRFTSSNSSTTSDPSPPLNTSNISPGAAAGGSISSGSSAPTPLDMLDFTANGSFDVNMNSTMQNAAAYGLSGFGDAGVMDIESILSGGMLPHGMGESMSGQKQQQLYPSHQSSYTYGQQLQQQQPQRQQQEAHQPLPPIEEAFPNVGGVTMIWGGP